MKARRVRKAARREAREARRSRVGLGERERRRARKVMIVAEGFRG